MDKIKFEKVSLEQFTKDLRKVLMPHITDEDAKDIYDKIQLPKRGSAGSAGYDFFSPFNFTLEDYDSSITIPTGIRAVMPLDTYLQIVPRSSIGFKTGVRLANQVAIIDADYSESSNEGHIMLKFVAGFNSLNVCSGDRIVQGIFLKYYITEDDNVTTVRTGGIGSTGK